MSGCNYVLPKMMQFWLSEPLLRPSERHVHQNGGWRWRLELRNSMPYLLGTSRLSCCSRTCQLFVFKFPQKNEEAKPVVNNVSPLGSSWGRKSGWVLILITDAENFIFDKAELGLTAFPITGGKDPCAVHLMYLLAVFVHIRGNGVQRLWRTGISLASELQVSSTWRNNSFCCVTTEPLDGICNGQAWKLKVMHVWSSGPAGLSHWGNRCERHWNLTEIRIVAIILQSLKMDFHWLLGYK